jgi:hypothetical protein
MLAVKLGLEYDEITYLRLTPIGTFIIKPPEAVPKRTGMYSPENERIEQ